MVDQLSLFTVDIPRKRSLIRPLDSAVAIWNVLSVLPIGAEVPMQVRILDYEDGDIPVWLLQEREDAGIVQVLTVIDKATLTSSMFGEQEGLAVEVFISPEKALTAPVYKLVPGGAKRRDKLGDIRQHARQMNERS